MKKIILTSLFLTISTLTVSAHAKNKLYTANALLVPRLYPATTTPVATQNLQYYGGPVISQVKAVPVFWSARVNSTIQSSMDDFYSSYVNSKHMDWLSEYNTTLNAVDGRAGTNQKIGRGSSMTPILIQPYQNNKKITDLDVQNEIEQQIDAGVLPRPDENTLYMIHFPADISISIEGMTSCFAFGGYHNGAKNKKYGDLFYAVLPECFFALDAEGSLAATTIVASHELIEAVTDAFPTPGSTPAYPQAWNDPAGNEIADMCPANSAILNGSKASYKISFEWSNSRGACYDGN